MTLAESEADTLEKTVVEDFLTAGSNLRTNPVVLNKCSALLSSRIAVTAQTIVGLYEDGIPLATCLAINLGYPLAYFREPKQHGTIQQIEGEIAGRELLLLRDPFTSPDQILLAIQALEQVGRITAIWSIWKSWSFRESRLNLIDYALFDLNAWDGQGL